MKLILKTAKVAAIATTMALTLSACDDGTADQAEVLVRPGCENPPAGLRAKDNAIVAPEVWKQVSETGSGWVVVVLADESAQSDDDAPDLAAIKAVQQRLLHDLDVNDDEKVFGGRNVAVISMKIDPGRARQLENLPYVCYVSSDRKLWPME